MTPDLQKLRALAMAATPGPWTWDEEFPRDLYGKDWRHILTVRALDTPDPDAEFIAAFNPKTILALLDRIDELEANAGQITTITAERDALRVRRDELLATIVKVTNSTPFADEAKDALEQRGKLLAEIGTLRSQLQTAQQERDAARVDVERMRPVYELAVRWCKRPRSCLNEGVPVLRNDAELFARLHDLVDTALTTNREKNQ